MEISSVTKQRIRILIVFFDEKNRHTYRSMFHDIDDCDVTYTNTPHDALQVFTGFLQQGFPFDIAFLDYQLPTSNGVAVAKKLKAVHPKIKIWFFESSHLKIEKIKTSYIELFGFFREPISTYDQIDEILEGARVRKQKQLKLMARAFEKK